MEANILTVLTILVAGYTLLAEEKRIDLILRFSWIDICIISLLASIVLYTIYLPMLNAINLALPFSWWPGFNKELTVFTGILAILLYLMVKLVGKRLPKSKITDWKKVSSYLLRNQKFEALAFLLDKYHVQLISIFSDTWQDRIRAKLLKPYRPSLEDLLNPNLDKEERGRIGSKVRLSFVNIFKPIALLISKCLPGNSIYKDEVSESIFDLLKSNLFVKYLTQTHPLLCAEFTTMGYYSNEEFTTVFLKGLIADISSPLYRELRDNQSRSYTGEYYIDQSNPLLNFYFADIEVGTRIGIWKPIGEYTLEFIGKQKGQDNYYNQPFSYSYYEDEKWSCPIFVSIHFFRIMTSRAIHTEYQDHMWLMYVKYFVADILKNYEPSSDVDISEEFPTRFDYLMYEALDTHIEWVRAVAHDSRKNNNVTTGEISTPVYWAATSLGNIFYSLTASRKITKRQCVYYLEMIIKLLKHLDNSGNQILSKIIFDNMIKEYEHAQPDQRIITELRDYYSDIDHVLRDKQSTFETELSNVYESLIR